MSTDPRDVIAHSPMSRLQILVVGVTIALNALDGFDILSISFASPGIATEWGIDRAALGIVLSMELIGMAIGSIVLGGVADKIGRRPTILGCLTVMAGGMLMATTVTGLVDLSIWRVVTGLGIGGMLASINAVAAEFSSTRRRHLSVSLMSIGYPLGAVVGGIVAARLLQGNDWRSVFYLGAGITTTLIPITYFLVPESVHWLARKQPNGALEKINRAMARMGYAATTALPTIASDIRQRSVSDIFGPGLFAITALVAFAYFFHITTFYFILKWVPKIVADFGFPASSAAGVLVWTNVGGALGGTVLGFLTLRFGVKGLTIVVMVLSTVAVALFGRTPPDLQQLSMI
jgi:MFS family permease